MARATLRVKDRGFAKFIAAGKSLRARPHVRVGVLGNTAPRDGKGLDNAELALVMEFGTRNGRIPARPFLGGTAERKNGEWLALLGKAIPKVLEGKLTIERALALVGERAAADVKRTITSSEGLAANAPSTIRRKGSSRPLIDTGRLLQSISYDVASTK